MSNNFEALEKEVWTPNLQRQLRESFLFSRIANTDFSTKFKEGTTVNFPRQSKVTIGTLTNFNETIQVQNLSTENEVFTLDTIKYFAFGINLGEKIENYITPESQAFEDVREGFSKAFDTAIAGEYSNALHIVDDGNMEVATNGGAGNSINLSKNNIYDLLTAVDEVLNNGDVPDTNRFAILGTAEQRLFNKSTDLVKPTVNGDEIVKKGFKKDFKGTVLDINIGFSKRCIVDSGVKHCLAGQGKPICFATNLAPTTFISSIKENQTKFAYLVKGVTQFGVRTFTEGKERLVDIRITA